jgi:hypothetical protein
VQPIQQLVHRGSQRGDLVTSGRNGQSPPGVVFADRGGFPAHLILWGSKTRSGNLSWDFV